MKLTDAVEARGHGAGEGAETLYLSKREGALSDKDVALFG